MAKGPEAASHGFGATLKPDRGIEVSTRWDGAIITVPITPKAARRFAIQLLQLAEQSEGRTAVLGTRA